MTMTKKEYEVLVRKIDAELDEKRIDHKSYKRGFNFKLLIDVMIDIRDFSHTSDRSASKIKYALDKYRHGKLTYNQTIDKVEVAFDDIHVYDDITFLD